MMLKSLTGTILVCTLCLVYRTTDAAPMKQYTRADIKELVDEYVLVDLIESGTEDKSCAIEKAKLDIKTIVTMERKKYASNIIGAIKKITDDPETETMGKENALWNDVGVLFENVRKAHKNMTNEKGDAALAAAGMCQMVSSLAESTLLKTIVPGGEVVSILTANMCSLVCTFLVEEQVNTKPTTEELVRKVIQKELSNYRKDDLLSKCKGKVHEAEMRLRVLSTLMLRIYEASNGKKAEITEKLVKNLSLISTSDFLLSNAGGFLEEIWHFIAMYSGDDQADYQKKIAADLLVQYAILSHYRKKELALLAGVYVAMGAEELSTAAIRTQDERLKLDEERMRYIFHHPECEFNKYLMREYKEKITLIHKLQPVPEFEAEDHFFKIVGKEGKEKYIYYDRKKRKLSTRAKVGKVSTKFQVYRKTDDDGKEILAIHSEKAGGFIMPVRGITKREKYVGLKRGRRGDEKYGWTFARGHLLWHDTSKVSFARTGYGQVYNHTKAVGFDKIKKIRSDEN